jgi:hypothetical protein
MADKNTILTEDKRKRGEMLQALRETKGIVWLACEKVGITRHQHNDWLRDDPDYREVCEIIKDERTDYVEGQLLKLIEGAEYEVITEHGIQVLRDAPCKASIKFYLGTIGKNRGFVERQEITGAEGGPVQIIAPDNI